MISHRGFEIIKIPTWSWWPLLIQILPVVKVVTAAFHIKNVARNHVNSSFLQRLPTVKLVWWHFLGLNNNYNTNNSVNSKKYLHVTFVHPKSWHFAHQTDHIHTFLVRGISLFQWIPRLSLVGAVTRSIRHNMEFSNAIWKVEKMKFWFSRDIISSLNKMGAYSILFTFSNRRTPFMKTDTAGNGWAFF